jgi:predicted DCC family thiol-disulfide oxidoreductase YuxK
MVPLQRAATDRPEVRRLREQCDLRRALHVIDEDGDWAAGGEAVIRALERIPTLRPLARLARLPGVCVLVEPSYRYLAARRARFSWLAGSFGPAQRIGGAEAGDGLSGWGRSRSRGRAGSARSRR